MKKKENEEQESVLEQRAIDAETRENIEKHLKNEAYAFLLSEGLVDKFLEFRTAYHRSRHQDSVYLLTMSADLGGLWIDQ